MDTLNYLYLHYFWAVARHGSVAAAADHLGLGSSTISTQIKKLEQQLGGRLFVKSGRSLSLSEFGRHVYDYADDIFSLGADLQASLEGRFGARRQHFRVGLADAVPKLIAYHLLAPALSMDQDLCLEVVEEHAEQLFAQLAIHKLDLVIADQPLAAGHHIRAYTHPLGESRVGFFASARVAPDMAQNFPACLNGAPLLLPHRSSSLCVDYELWCEEQGIHPRVIGHLADSALAKVFAAGGHGAILAPMAVRSHLLNSFQLDFIGVCDPLRVRYHAVSMERRIRHPAIQAVCRGAHILLDDDLPHHGDASDAALND